MPFHDSSLTLCSIACLHAAVVERIPERLTEQFIGGLMSDVERKNAESIAYAYRTGASNSSSVGRSVSSGASVIVAKAKVDLICKSRRPSVR